MIMFFNFLTQIAFQLPETVKRYAPNHLLRMIL